MPVKGCQEQILSEEYRDFIVGEAQKDLFRDFFGSNLCEQRCDRFYKIIYVEKDRADPIQFGTYPYRSVPKCYTLLDREAMSQAGITQVQNYPTLELQGSGVLLGFIDTGIDYRNPVFCQLDGSTRIVGLWDQTISEGTPPVDLSYGTEYGADVINRALQSENPYDIVPSRDENGHGTFLASLAAGNASDELRFIGAAPDAQIAVVKLKPAKQYLKDFYLIRTGTPCYQETDIMLGVRYLNRLADSLGLPLVICLALGTNQGSHSANSPLTDVLEVTANLANRGVVIGSGNEANQRHHYYGVAENGAEAQQVEVRVGENVSGFCAELWSEALNLLAVSVVSPSGEQTYRFPLRSEQTARYTFVLEGTELSVDYKVFTEGLNAELVFLRFSRPSAGIWKILVEPVQVEKGEYHLWLPVMEFLENEVYFLQSNPDYTVTEPGSTLSGITVAFYDGNNNSIAIPSGRGYTRGERIKPDFAAPGVNVLGAGARNQFVSRTGSSVAAAITAGAVALMMEWVVYRLRQKNIDATQIRNLFVLGTDRRPNEVYPNREWGYGTLNVYQTFERIRRI